MRQMIISLAVIGLSAYLSAQEQSVLKRGIQPQPALFDPSRPNVPKHNFWRLDPGHSTANLFVGSGVNSEAFLVGDTRVSGTVLIDRTEPADSWFNLTFYPAGVGGPTSPDGKLASGRNPNDFSDTELIFKSTRTVPASHDTLMVSGDLTLVRIGRGVNVVLNEAYAGPTYGDPAVHTVTHHLTLLLIVDSDGSRPNEPITIVGRFRVPGLRSAVLHTSWPTVVEDDHCQGISDSGEGYFGPSCTGETVAGFPEPVTRTGESEDFDGFEGAPPTGSRVTIDFRLVMVPAASSLSEGSKSGGGGFGGGIRFYPYGNFFVRPEMRLYLINNNEEFMFGPSSSLWCLDWLRSRREQIWSDMPRCALTRWQ